MMTRKRKTLIRTTNPIVDGCLVLFMIGFSIIMLYPFINVIAVSLSSSAMINSGTITWFPKELNVKGYEIVFGQATIWRAYGNTVLYAAVGTVINLFLTSLIAYALSVPEFVLRKFVTFFLLITLFFSGGTVPIYLVVKDTGIMNSIWALVLPNAVGAYAVFIYRAFFKGISNELREAARIDGAGEFRILFQVFMPLSKALYATFGLFSVVGFWNNYFDSLLYMKDSAKHPIQMVLRTVLFKSGAAGGSFDGVNQMQISGILNPKNVQYACIFATIAPILLIYPFIQKYFEQGLQVGAVKG